MRAPGVKRARGQARPDQRIQTGRVRKRWRYAPSQNPCTVLHLRPLAMENTMASPHTMQRSGLAGWTLMTAIHDALRRDLDELLHGTASGPGSLARWAMFRDQLQFHLAAEKTALWPSARAKLAVVC